MICIPRLCASGWAAFGPLSFWRHQCSAVKAAGRLLLFRSFPWESDYRVSLPEHIDLHHPRPTPTHPQSVPASAAVCGLHCCTSVRAQLTRSKIQAVSPCLSHDLDPRHSCMVGGIWGKFFFFSNERLDGATLKDKKIKWHNAGKRPAVPAMPAAKPNTTFWELGNHLCRHAQGSARLSIFILPWDPAPEPGSRAAQAYFITVEGLKMHEHGSLLPSSPSWGTCSLYLALLWGLLAY